MQIQAAANAGGLKLTPLEQHAGVNTGGSNVLQLTPELAAVPQPPGPGSPRDQLKATLREIIKKQKSLLTPQGVSDYLAGYSEGFIAGAKGTLDLIKSLPSLPGQIVQATGDGFMAVYNGAGEVATVIGDLAGSLWNWTSPSTAIQAGRTVQRVVNKAVITAQNAGVILADLYAMAGELEAIVGTNLLRGLFGPAPSGTADTSALDQILDRASPLTIAILNLVASAAAESRSASGRLHHGPGERAGRRMGDRHRRHQRRGYGNRERGIGLADRESSRRRGSD